MKIRRNYNGYQLARKYKERYLSLGSSTLILVFVYLLLFISYMIVYNCFPESHLYKLLPSYDFMIQAFGVIYITIAISIFIIFLYYNRIFIKVKENIKNEDVKNILMDISNSNNRGLFDLFLFSIWNHIRRNDELYNLFYSEKYEEINELKNSDYYMVSFLKCFCYTYFNRVFRAPSLITNIEIRAEIVQKYYDLILKEKKSEGRKEIFDGLQEIELEYIKYRRKDKQDGKRLGYIGLSVIDILALVCNNSTYIYFFKMACIWGGIALTILHFNHLIFSDEIFTLIFEIITIVLLVFDIYKDKDYEMLH